MTGGGGSDNDYDIDDCNGDDNDDNADVDDVGDDNKNEGKPS